MLRSFYSVELRQSRVISTDGEKFLELQQYYFDDGTFILHGEVSSVRCIINLDFFLKISNFAAKINDMNAKHGTFQEEGLIFVIKYCFIKYYFLFILFIV